MQLDVNSQTLRSSDLYEIEVALERWTHAWQQAQHSILDPRNPDASNPFTSTSLLGLAFARLYTLHDSYRRLNEWQPKRIGLQLARAPASLRMARDTCLATCNPAVEIGLEPTSRRQFHH